VLISRRPRSGTPMTRKAARQRAPIHRRPLPRRRWALCPGGFPARARSSSRRCRAGSRRMRTRRTRPPRWPLALSRGAGRTAASPPTRSRPTTLPPRRGPAPAQSCPAMLGLAVRTAAGPANPPQARAELRAREPRRPGPPRPQRWPRRRPASSGPRRRWRGCSRRRQTLRPRGHPVPRPGRPRPSKRLQHSRRHQRSRIAPAGHPPPRSQPPGSQPPPPGHPLLRDQPRGSHQSGRRRRRSRAAPGPPGAAGLASRSGRRPARLRRLRPAGRPGPLAGRPGAGSWPD
jgi:hypothetical protein